MFNKSQIYAQFPPFLFTFFMLHIIWSVNQWTNRVLQGERKRKTLGSKFILLTGVLWSSSSGRISTQINTYIFKIWNSKSGGLKVSQQQSGIQCRNKQVCDWLLITLRLLMVGSNDKRNVSKAMTTSMWSNKEDMSDLCLVVRRSVHTIRDRRDRKLYQRSKVIYVLCYHCLL